MHSVVSCCKNNNNKKHRKRVCCRDYKNARKPFLTMCVCVLLQTVDHPADQQEGRQAAEAPHPGPGGDAPGGCQWTGTPGPQLPQLPHQQRDHTGPGGAGGSQSGWIV